MKKKVYILIITLIVLGLLYRVSGFSDAAYVSSGSVTKLFESGELGFNFSGTIDDKKGNGNELLESEEIITHTIFIENTHDFSMSGMHFLAYFGYDIADGNHNHEYFLVETISNIDITIRDLNDKESIKETVTDYSTAIGKISAPSWCNSVCDADEVNLMIIIEDDVSVKTGEILAISFDIQASEDIILDTEFTSNNMLTASRYYFTFENAYDEDKNEYIDEVRLGYMSSLFSGIISKDTITLELDKYVVDKNNDGITSPGEELTYTLTVENIGEPTAKNVVIQDDLVDIKDYLTSTDVKIEVDSTDDSKDSSVIDLNELMDGLTYTMEPDEIITISFTVEVGEDLNTDMVTELVNTLVVVPEGKEITDPNIPKVEEVIETENGEEAEYRVIDGTLWLDDNQDGIMNDDYYIGDVEVQLFAIDVLNEFDEECYFHQNIVPNVQGNDLHIGTKILSEEASQNIQDRFENGYISLTAVDETVTDKNGYYSFEVDEGEYDTELFVVKVSDFGITLVNDINENIEFKVQSSEETVGYYLNTGQMLEENINLARTSSLLTRSDSLFFNVVSLEENSLHNNFAVYKSSDSSITELPSTELPVTGGRNVGYIICLISFVGLIVIKKIKSW